MYFVFLLENSIMRTDCFIIYYYLHCVIRMAWHGMVVEGPGGDLSDAG